MLLTLAKPAKAEFEYKTHEYSPTFYSAKSARFSPTTHGRSAPSLPASVSSTMATEHRGLPPPSAMTLPNPSSGTSTMSSFGPIPPAPTQWRGADDDMKNWLMAKSEEEKRRQEEEKTKQEELRLDQRRIERDMLHTSMNGGVPPHLIPMIFAGIGGASIANMTSEWIQQYTSQLQAGQQLQIQQQQQHQVQAPQGLHTAHSSPDSHRPAQTAPPGLFGQMRYGGAPQTPQSVVPPATTVLPGQPLPGQPHQPAFTPPGRNAAVTSMPRPPPPPPQSGSQLPRINTTELHVQPPLTATSVNQQSQAHQQQTQQQHQSHHPQQQEQQSPGIYFHHWVPPSQQDKSSSGHQPATPSGKYKISSSSQAGSYPSDPDYTSSPKRRKLGNQAQPDPPVTTTAPTQWVPPMTTHSYTSPSYSTSSTSTPKRGHGRNRSDASVRGIENPRATMSRRGTMRSQEYVSTMSRHAESPEQHYSNASVKPEGPYQDSYAQPRGAPAPTEPLQRNDGRGDGPQARAPSPRGFQGETRQSGQQLAAPGPRSVPTSPKKGDHGYQN